MTILHYVPHSVLYTALPIGNRRSCFVCRRTPGPDLPFGIDNDFMRLLNEYNEWMVQQQRQHEAVIEFLRQYRS